MGILNWFLKKNKQTNKPAKNVSVNRVVRILDKIETLKNDDKVEFEIFGVKKILTISCHSEDNREILTNAEISEIEWFRSSKPWEDEKIKKEMLQYINCVYEVWDDNWKEGEIKSVKKEIDFTTVIVDFSESDFDTDEPIKIIALAGDALCDEEHGISVAFQNRSFFGVNSFGEYNYGPSETTSENPQGLTPYELREKNFPLEKMAEKFVRLLVANNLVDENRACFFSHVLIRPYGKEVQAIIKKDLEFREYNRLGFAKVAVTAKGEELLVFKVDDWGHKKKTEIQKDIDVSMKNLIRIHKDGIKEIFIECTNSYYKKNLVIVTNDNIAHVITLVGYKDDELSTFLIKRFKN